MLMEDDQKIANYFSKLMMVVNQMKTCGEVFTDQQINEKVMRTLTSKFDFIVVAIQESRDIGTMKIEDLQSSLEAHELLIIERGTKRTMQQALQVQSKPAGKDQKKWKQGKEKWLKNKGKIDDKVESSKGEGSVNS